MSSPNSPTPSNTDQMLQMIMTKLSGIELNISILVKENENRIQEIGKLGQAAGLIPNVETDKEGQYDRPKPLENENRTPEYDEGHARPRSHPLSTFQKRESLGRPNDIQSTDSDDESDHFHPLSPTFLPTLPTNAKSCPRQINVENKHPNQANREINQNSAKDMIRTIKPINGQDDMGVEDFIKTVKRAQKRCSQPELLLDFILAEKITHQAEKCLRYTRIRDFDTLYETLRSNLKQTGSVSALRSKIDSCKQGPMETTQNFNMRFRQISNDLNYAVQASHSGPTKRHLAIEIEKEECLKKYLLNLRREIGLQVKAQKPSDLAEAQNNAIEMEMWLREAQPNSSTRNNLSLRLPTRPNISMPIKQFTPRQNIPTTGPTPSQPVSRPPLDKSKQTCHKCGKPGHFAAQCYSKNTNFSMGQYGSRPPQVRNIQEDGETIFFEQMTEEEVSDQIHYEDTAEYQQSMDDYNQSLEENTMEPHTDF